MSQRFRTLEDFQNGTLKRLAKVLKEPLRFEVMNVIGGDQEWASVELRAQPVECKNGRSYEMVYAWNIRFNDEGMIVQVRAYLDTALLTDTLRENECGSYRSPRDVY